MQLGVDAHPLRPVLDVVGERRAQAEVVERGGSQLPDELIDVPVEPLCEQRSSASTCARSSVLSPHASLSSPIRRPSAVNCSPN